MLYVVTERYISTGTRIESFNVKHHVTKSLESALTNSYECAKKYSNNTEEKVSYDKRNTNLEELTYNNIGSYYFDYEGYGWWNYSVFITEKNIDDNEEFLFTISTSQHS
jgi:hypothetical protein